MEKIYASFVLFFATNFEYLKGERLYLLDSSQYFYREHPSVEK